jgi:hypothetical protein
MRTPLNNPLRAATTLDNPNKIRPGGMGPLGLRIFLKRLASPSGDHSNKFLPLLHMQIVLQYLRHTPGVTFASRSSLMEFAESATWSSNVITTKKKRDYYRNWTEIVCSSPSQFTYLLVFFPLFRDITMASPPYKRRRALRISSVNLAKLQHKIHILGQISCYYHVFVNVAVSHVRG